MKRNCFHLQYTIFALLVTFFLTWSIPSFAQSDSKNEFRYKKLYLAAIRQKQKNNDDAAYELLKKALLIKPNASEAIYEMASLYQQLYPEEPERAIILLKKAIDIEPQNNYYKKDLAQLYIDTRQEDKAIKIYEIIAQKEKDPTEELNLLVQLYETRSDYNSALKTLDRLILINGDNDMYLMEKIRLFSQLNKNEEALKTTLKLIEQNPNNLNLKILLGDNYLANNDTIKGLNIYKEVLQKDSNQQNAQIALMKYYNSTKEEKAFLHLRELFLLNPNVSGQTKIALFQDFIKKDKEEKIYNSSEKLIDLMQKIMLRGKPKNDLIEFFAAYLYTKKIHTPQSIPLLQEILRQQPENAIGRIQMLQVMMEKKDYEACKNICLEGTLYNPTELIFYYYGSLAQTLLKDYKGSLETVNKGLSKINDHSNTAIISELYFSKAETLHELKEKEAGYLAYDSCLIYNNNNIQCLNNYAYLLSLEEKELEKAEEMSLKAIKQEPNNASYLDTYAWILFKRNKMLQAKTYIDKTIKLFETSEESANVYEHAGDIYYQNHLKEEAIKFWKKAKELGADSDLLKKKIKRKKYFKK